MMTGIFTFEGKTGKYIVNRYRRGKGGFAHEVFVKIADRAQVPISARAAAYDCGAVGALNTDRAWNQIFKRLAKG